MADVAAQRARADRAFSADSGLSALRQDAYDYVLPMRRPGGASRSKRVADKIFDMTAPNSAMHLAGVLQRLLFSQPPSLMPGALTRQAFAAQGPSGAKALSGLERVLERTGEFIYPFMEAGDLATATHEMCIDLGFGTGALLPMRGDANHPIHFLAIPDEEIALSGDAFGRTTFASWRRPVARGALLQAWPHAKFSADFIKAAKEGPSADIEVTLYQDFWQLPDGRWQFAAYLDRECDEFLAWEVTRTKPIATPRYYRVAGEIKGRGPVLLALPAIKVLNKAQELALKAAAMQMLGIWGYRSGAGFNPDTAAIAPGAMYEMQSTGGVMGPDISRLDPASGRLDVASMVIDGLQQQVRDAMMDTRLPQETGTPKSASEIAARMSQNSQVHLGAFMRLHREVHPDIIPRCAEILNSFGYLKGVMDFNELIVSVGVRSPMAAALSAEKVGNIVRYAEMMTALVGPQNLPDHLVTDTAGDAIADGMMIPRAMVPDAQARAASREERQQQMAAAAETAMLEKAAPQLAGGALKMIEGGLAA